MENLMSDSRKVVLITGGSQGIGASLVRAYRDRNYRVVATSRSIAPSTDPDLLTVAGDIGDPETGAAVVGRALEQFGRVDTLVNNAGVFLAGPFTHYTPEQYRSVVATNLGGFFFVTQAAVAAMENQGSGHVVSFPLFRPFSRR
jgi:NAD(P)-dependent dehydrogenase (short-subunit alcohol dehydrogenase family)